MRNVCAHSEKEKLTVQLNAIFLFAVCLCCFSLSVSMAGTAYAAI